MTIFLKPKTRYISTGSGTNVNIQGIIEGAGIFQGEVELTILAGSTIGSTNGLPALITGDLKRYREVRLVNNGEIQGKSGNANSGNGGHAFTATSNIVITNNGAFRSGGGGGGKGGKGGAGNYANYGGWVNSFGNPRYRWDQKDNKADVQILWKDVSVYRNLYFGWKPYGQAPTAWASPYTYQRAATPRWQNRFYDIRRGATANSTGTTGGNGGRGSGYTLGYHNGSYAAVPSNFAGRGGRGGRGAWFGGRGATGATGASGTKSVGGGTNPGTGGTGGGYAGWALYAYKDAFISMSRIGTVNGPTHYNGVQPTEHNENLPNLIED